MPAIQGKTKNLNSQALTCSEVVGPELILLFNFLYRVVLLHFDQLLQQHFESLPAIYFFTMSYNVYCRWLLFHRFFSLRIPIATS